jgi:hypothetical protein
VEVQHGVVVAGNVGLEDLEERVAVEEGVGVLVVEANGVAGGGEGAEAEAEVLVDGTGELADRLALEAADAVDERHGRGL